MVCKRSYNSNSPPGDSPKELYQVAGSAFMLKYAVCGVFPFYFPFYFFTPAWHSHPWNRLRLNVIMIEKLWLSKPVIWEENKPMNGSSPC